MSTIRWKNIAIISTVIGGIAAATYPVIIAPYLDPQPWKHIQKTSRNGIDREKIQPGGMKPWTDPFEKKD